MDYKEGFDSGVDCILYHIDMYIQSSTPEDAEVLNKLMTYLMKTDDTPSQHINAQNPYPPAFKEVAGTYNQKGGQTAMAKTAWIIVITACVVVLIYDHFNDRQKMLKNCEFFRKV